MKRRILLGGLGLALGALANPAVAQDPPARRVTLGRPIPVSTPSQPSVITPVQAIVPGGVVPPPPVSMPVGTFPVPPGVVGQPKSGVPSVTELRDPSGKVPHGVMLGAPTPYGAPGTMLTGPLPGPGGVIVPSVGPEVCPPGMETPMFGAPLPAEGVPVEPGRRFAGLFRHAPGESPWWTSAEYLMWWTRSTQLPPLVTTSSPQFGGFVGVGDTRTLLEGSFGDTFHSGARFGVGRWFDPEHVRGIEGRFFFLGANSSTFHADTNSYPLLARPFVNVNQPVGSFAEVVAAPGLATGTVAVDLKNSLWGADVNFRRNLGGSECARLDALVGYRFLNFKERLRITETFVRTPGSDLAVGSPAVAGTITDSFRTENNFHGGQIGLAGEVRRGRWYLDGRASIAFGTTFQRAEISGSQVLNLTNGAVAAYNGGLLAVPGANIGTYSHSAFAVVPEVGLNLGYHLTPRLRVSVGYNFLYLSNVLRPAELIDTNIDAARIPNFPLPGSPAPLSGVARPMPGTRSTDFFAQGINFGLSFTW